MGHNIHYIGFLGTLALLGACATPAQPSYPTSIALRSTAATSASLATQCYSEARAIHSNGTFTKQRAFDSPAMREHTSKLAQFCDAYQGRVLPVFWDQLTAANRSDMTLSGAFEAACIAEARGGHTVVFKPSAEHVARMSSICRALASDLGPTQTRSNT